MVILRNLCILLGILCMIGVYYGFKHEMFEVVITLSAGTVLCAFMGVYCHGERYEDK